MLDMVGRRADGGAQLEVALQELEEVYARVDNPLPDDGELLASLEQTIVQKPAEHLADVIVRVRALIAIWKVEGGVDQTLLTGLCRLLEDLRELERRGSSG